MTFSRRIDNLFDPRGVECAHVCEVCQAPLDEKSLLSTCAECFTEDDSDA